MLFLDFSKVFEKVHHPSLLEKLSKYGIAGNLLKWLSAFLSKRRQMVVLGEDHSDLISVMSDVPQGSSLGPTVFAVFINDLPYDVLSTCKIFADDSKIIATIRPDQGSEERAKLQSDIDIVKQWCKNRHMVLNSEKCKVMNLGKGNNGGGYTIENEASQRILLNKTTSERDLGNEISNDLEPHN